ncbi:MAG: ribonuclease R [Clostridiales bacterium]|nr:ribonuclease R [Clostridiales bacterium]
MKIVEIIKENTLVYLTLDKLSKKLGEITGEAPTDLKYQINQLIKDGDLFLDDDKKISVSADRGLFKAKMVLNRKGYGFAQVEGYPDFFIPAFAINGAFDGDDCLVEITNRKTEEEIEGRVVRILGRNTTHVVGTYIEGKSKNVVFPDDDKLPQIRIFKNDANKAKNNDKVWVELDMASIETNMVRGKVVEVLGQANTPKAEQISIIRAYNLVEEFEPSVMNAVKAISQEVDIKNFKKRKDFTKQRVITIDGEDARDFDDAISVERQENGGYKLFVHIADVSNYVVENSPLDKSAYKRGTSVYFPNMVIPMLPKEISNGVCSLSEGVNRLVLSVVIDLDKDCNVKSSEIYEGVIKSRHRMTYTEVQNILESDEFLIEKYGDVYDDILCYQDIAKKLQDKRALNGEIRMDLPEPFILENQQGEIVSIENRVQDESHRIIESLMVLTNECVAKTFYDLVLPFVYRVHEKPDEEKVTRLSQLLKNMGVANELDKSGDKPISYQKVIEKINGTPKERTLTKLILRSMMKARYASTCLGHFGLASEYYCHFTSPIRRYPDLMIHRIIKEFLHGVSKQDLKAKYQAIVERVSVQSSDTERNADEAEREVNDYKKAVYMTKFLGQQFTGTISGVQEFGIFVELENGVEGLVKLDSLPMDEYIYDDMSLTLHGSTHHYTIGDSVDIIVANANTHLRQIDFDLVGVEKSHNIVINKNEKIKKNKSKNKDFTKNSRKISKKSSKTSKKSTNKRKRR